jgi:hypothetical protein
VLVPLHSSPPDGSLYSLAALVTAPSALATRVVERTGGVGGVAGRLASDNGGPLGLQSTGNNSNYQLSS